MTAFLSRLVERSASNDAPSPLPVMPPLFAAGSMLGEASSSPEPDPSTSTGGPSAASGAGLPGGPTVSTRRPSGDPDDATADGAISRGERADGRDVSGHVAPAPLDVSGRTVPATAPTVAQLRRAEGSVARDTGISPRLETAPAERSAWVHPVVRVGRGAVPDAVERDATVRAGPIFPAARPERADGRASTAAAPIVRVSIGRIEVRAVSAPPPAPPRQAAPTPKRAGIVLEDYLRARGKKP